MKKTLKPIAEEMETLSELKFTISVYRNENTIDSIGIRWEKYPDICLYHSQGVKEKYSCIEFNLAQSAKINGLLRNSNWVVGNKTSQEVSLKKNERRGWSLILPCDGKSRYVLELIRQKQEEKS